MGFGKVKSRESNGAPGLFSPQNYSESNLNKEKPEKWNER